MRLIAALAAAGAAVATSDIGLRALEFSQLDCDVTSNSSVPLVRQPLDGSASDSQNFACGLANPGDVAFFYVGPQYASHLAASATSAAVSSSQAADFQATMRIVSVAEDSNFVNYSKPWTATSGTFDARASAAFAATMLDLGASQPTLRYASVLPPTAIQADVHFGGVVLPAHSIGLGASRVAPALARLQIARQQDSNQVAAVFQVHEEIPSGTAAYVEARRPGDAQSTRASMLVTMEPEGLRSALAGQGSGVSLQTLGRVTHVAALSAEATGASASQLRGRAEVCIGISYPPSLWIMSVVGVESTDLDFQSHLAKAAAEEESLAWQVNPTTVQQVIAPDEFTDYTQEADAGNSTSVPSGSPALDYLAVAEERFVDGDAGASEVVARARCAAVSAGQGLGLPSGLGPVAMVASDGSNPLLLTSLHYDEDVVWSASSAVTSVDTACRRRRTVILAALATESSGSEWTTVAAASIDAPRGIVSMALDASQSYLWAVDRESRMLGALPVSRLAPAALARASAAGTTAESRFGGSILRMEWATFASVRVSLSSLGIPTPQRSLFFGVAGAAGDVVGAYSDLIAALAPDLSSPAGVLVAGYADDRSRTVQEYPQSGVESIEVAVASISYTGTGADLQPILEADAALGSSSNVSAPLSVSIRRLETVTTQVQAVGSAQTQDSTVAANRLLARAGLGLDFRSSSACGVNPGEQYYVDGQLTAPTCRAPTVCTGNNEEGRGPRRYQDRACVPCGKRSFGVSAEAARLYLAESSPNTSQVLLPPSADHQWTTVLQQAERSFGVAAGANEGIPVAAASTIQAWTESNYPLDPLPSQIDHICYPCHRSCRECDGFSQYNCTSCPFPWGLVEQTITERERDDFTGNIIETSSQVKACTPGPKYDTWTVGVGIAVPGAVMILGLLLAGADLDAFVLVAIAYSDLATDVLYTFTEEYHSEALFWASFASLAVVPVLPFVLTLHGEPGLLMLIPRGLEGAQEQALGKDCSDLEHIFGCDPFDASFELINDGWECVSKEEVIFLPLGVMGEWMGEDEIPFSPAFVAKQVEAVMDFCDGSDFIEVGIGFIAGLVCGLPWIIFNMVMCLAFTLLGFALQVVYMLVLVAGSLFFLASCFVVVLVLLVAYRLLFSLPIGIGLLRKVLGEQLGLDWYKGMTETFPFFQPFEENDQLGKFLVTLLLQPLYWAAALSMLVLFLIFSLIALFLAVAVGMILYATRLLALKPVQEVWIKVWTLDPNAEVPKELSDDSVGASAALLPVAFKQMMVSELVFESLPELVVQALNNQARNAWSLLAIISFAFTALVVLDAGYRYVWFLLIKGVLADKTWNEAWGSLPLFQLTKVIGGGGTEQSDSATAAGSSKGSGTGASGAAASASGPKPGFGSSGKEDGKASSSSPKDNKSATAV